MKQCSDNEARKKETDFKVIWEIIMIGFDD